MSPRARRSTAKGRRARRAPARKRAARDGASAGAVAQPRIVLKFTDAIVDQTGLPYDDDVATRLDPLGVGPWNGLAASHPGIAIARLFTVTTPAQFQSLVGQANRRAPGASHSSRPAFSVTRYLSYFLVRVPQEVDIDAVAAELRTWTNVETAFVEGVVRPPSVSAFTNPSFASPPGQKYLRSAAVESGIDAEFAWSLEPLFGVRGGDGATPGTGLAFTDIETGWNLLHTDLSATAFPAIPLLGGVNEADLPPPVPPPAKPLDDYIYHIAHGTAVLGIVCARDNAAGCVGVVPSLKSPGCYSYLPVGGGGATLASTADSITATSDKLQEGDVLLLEIEYEVRGDPQARSFPVEVAQPAFEVIKLATGAGRIVVEAGGNGNKTTGSAVDLDTYPAAPIDGIVNPGTNDSGAIIVSAANSPLNPPALQRRPYAPYGTRVDCYAWGDNVVACWWHGPRIGTLSDQQADFNGTSAAAAIVAGAALAVQALAESNFGQRMGTTATGPTSIDMRTLLRDPAFGTSPAPEPSPTAGPIGVMPDLRKIIEDHFKLAPKVFLRDFIGDDGVPNPPTATLWRCPDILLNPRFPSGVTSPQAAFGETSPRRNDPMLSQAARPGQDNVLYVRVLNRDANPAPGIVVDLYSSPAATLPLPGMWTLIGRTAPALTVPGGRQLTVSDAIKFPAALVPASGHNCFIALLGTTARPPLRPASLIGMDEFRDLVRNHGTIVWRNYILVPVTSGSPVILEFLAPGSPRGPESMTIEVQPSLPAAASLHMEVPIGFAQAIPGNLPHSSAPGSPTATVVLAPQSVTTFDEFLFPAGKNLTMRFRVTLPAGLLGPPRELTVRQTWNGATLGGITWRLVPFFRPPPPISLPRKARRRPKTARRPR